MGTRKNLFTKYYSLRISEKSHRALTIINKRENISKRVRTHLDIWLEKALTNEERNEAGWNN